MLAVIELGGNQFIVRKGDVIDVKKLENEVGTTLTVEAMLVSDEEGKELKVGTPTVSGSKIEMKVIDEFKGDKIRVFKMKSKKRYARTIGFRPQLTKLEVLSIA
ncbi:MAG: 50S ribosomal protein L21 [Candidatus Gracilibacteria bacterium]|nr:50S ribosomal protein L21 [Candidatus Gracilibacteria bacterium]